MLMVDSELMFAAISYHEEETRDIGYLNRRSGEIVFVWDSERNAQMDGGNDLAIDSFVARKQVQAAADDWIEIPKYDPHDDGQNQEEAFCEEFFRKNGIDVILVY